MKRELRSFIIRSRMTNRQKQAMHDYWSYFGIEIAAELLDLQTIFQNTAPIILEIGFGMGGTLLQLAQAYPQYNFLGVEVHPAGVGALLAELAEKQIFNVRILFTDAVPILQNHIPDNSFSQILLFFPDPWPKRRHHKRRIVHPSFVNLIYQKLCKAGYFHLATDITNYADHMVKVLSMHPGFAMINGCSSYLPRPKTKFEKRGERLGHSIIDLVYQKQ